MFNQKDGVNDPFYQTRENENVQANVNEENLSNESLDHNDERTFLEETSAEFTHPIEQDERDDKVHHAYGWIALALSIISFFFIPILFATAGIVVGIIARNRRSTLLGYSAIVLGVLSFIVRLFLFPFM